MKPSKAKKMTKIKADPSRVNPNPPESLIEIARDVKESENEAKRTINWLIAAFPNLSLEQIDSSYQEAGGDAYKAAGILGAELVDPGESARTSGKKCFARKQKRVAASTGTISCVIGKDYSNSASSRKDGVRGWGHPLEPKVCGRKEAEEFLCSMLSGDSELDMDVIRDVLCQCGYDLEKALDGLLEMAKFANIQLKERSGVDHVKLVSGAQIKGTMKDSELHHKMLHKIPSRNLHTSFQVTNKPSVSAYHQSANERDNLQFMEYGCRDYLKVALNIKEKPPLTAEMVIPDLQKMILESLFNISEGPCLGNSMIWNKVVKQVESFGQGLGFCFEGSAESIMESGNVGEGDDYHAFRSVSQKNWNTMRSYYQKATLAYSNGQLAHASYLSEKGKFYKKLAEEADEKASKEIFESRNRGMRNIVTIDLHGQHVKQAIRLLKLHLLLFSYIPSVQFLRVVTGCGSDGLGLGKLKRTVLDLAKKECIKCSEENSGTLLLTIVNQRSFSFLEPDSDET